MRSVGSRLCSTTLGRVSATWLYHVLGDNERLALKSHFIEECRKQPGGYLPLELIYENSPHGDTLLHNLADCFYLNCFLARAAPLRVQSADAWLAGEADKHIGASRSIRIPSLACGGARAEIAAFAGSPLANRVTLHGIDIDDEALAFARMQAETCGLGPFVFSKGNALKPAAIPQGGGGCR